MKILLTAVLLVGVAAGVHAATTPGTIISTSASVEYADDSGAAMAPESSEPESVLVVSPTPTKPVYMTVKSLFEGPTTVGRTIRLAGKLIVDANGTWIDDGSVVTSKDSTGNPVVTKLLAKMNTTFVTGAPAPSTGMIVVTGISQKADDGSPMVIPSDSTQMQIP